MIGAGLIARKAVELGLKVKPWVKTSLAPGSKVVTKYLEKSNLLPYLEKLGFYNPNTNPATIEVDMEKSLKYAELNN